MHQQTVVLTQAAWEVHREPTNVFLRRCGRAHGVSRKQAITLFILENLENRGLCLHSCRSVYIEMWTDPHLNLERSTYIVMVMC